MLDLEACTQVSISNWWFSGAEVLVAGTEVYVKGFWSPDEECLAGF